PLPSVPLHELNNKVITSTIENNPHLFSVSTPFKVDVLREKLVSHPNPAFVESVCHGLSHGFWPWADTAGVILPYKLDAVEYLSDPTHIEFAKRQRDIEIEKKRFSPTFTELLPGMLSVPVSVATKKNSSKLRLCVNHSAEPFPLNALIDKKRVTVPLDDLQSFGRRL
ncbi:hypothetical protein M413DRAFT_48041, partial [Hebeloma cylindrosporum]